MSSLPSPEEYRALIKRVNTSSYFLNRQLQHICDLNGMKTSGVKAELQRRIVEALNESYQAGDAQSYRELEQSIYREKQEMAPASRGHAVQPLLSPLSHQSSSSGTNNYGNANHSHLQQASASSSSGPNNMPNNFSFSQSNGGGGSAYGGGYGGKIGGMHGRNANHINPQGPHFHSSPFYHVLARIGNAEVCEAMAQHRNSISVLIKAQDYPILAQCKDDKSLRVMVFCAAGNLGTQEIAFPHQSELKVNGDEIKANLRGLKNKPGSTRPVDITDMLRLKLPNYSNTVDFTYALTTKAGGKAFSVSSERFYLVINICKVLPVKELVDKIVSKKISKAAVKYELSTKAADDDIELSSQVLSLKCPLSYMRLVTPIRATTCTHVQCFDADSYLQLQQQGPQWLCPVCNNSAPFERLAIDEYVRDILDNTSKSMDQVDIQPNGEWKVHGAEEEAVQPEPQSEAFEIEDDGFAVISDISHVGNRSTNTPPTLDRSTAVPTPAPGASREGSSISRPSAGGSNKRPAEVIDLTLSDDEDDDRPAPKRQQFRHPGYGDLDSRTPLFR